MTPRVTVYVSGGVASYVADPGVEVEEILVPTRIPVLVAR